MKKILALLIVTVCVYDAFSQTKFTTSMFGPYEARAIGPAVMGGRITAIEGLPSDARTIYVGTAAGGIWKSTTGGTIFKPIFDKYTQSIGAMAIDPQNEKTIWAGTGESNMRNSVSYGAGIYKTTDAGDNWQLMGLDSTEHISKIAIDAKNSNTVYVACPGPLWSDSPHRGLYKTTDGGKTWNKILFGDNKTGCADVMVDPKNPQIVYASLWTFRRTGWSFESGGDKSGLFKSNDGGATWRKIQKGFDGQMLGRICLALAPSAPNNLYAIAEAKETALYSSKDGGENWTKQSNNQNVSWRPFYFSAIIVDPIDSNRIYRPSLSLSYSNDGGQSFSEASQEGGWVHSDHHALWINPKNNNQIFLGTDGGVYMSLDRGVNFVFLNNIPVSQFYHVSYDNQEPYNVYGGLQDNGSWCGPTQSPNGIENKDWTNVGGGDGFWVQPDLLDPNFVYAESQGGNMTRFNKKYNEFKDIQPYPAANETKLRWNWNTPLYSNPGNPGTLYCGAQYLYRTTNKGETWERISPDLTTNDPLKQKQESSGGITVDNSSAENHCTIYAIAESPLDKNNIWVGTDDGNLQYTDDGGKTWNNVTKNISCVPTFTWCSSIEPSPWDKNTVYATFENHTRGDFKPYIIVSTDKGKTWINLATADVKGFAHIVRQDIVNKNLLFAGTETGMFISMDGGKTWIAYTSKIPATPVRDLKINPKTNDLIIATHGRGIFIIDDLTPLRNLTPNILEQDAALLTTRPNYLSLGQFGAGFPSAGGYSGRNFTEEAVIYYYLKDKVMTGDVRVEVYDKNGVLLEKIPGSKRKGINRVTWGMKLKAPKVAKGIRLDFSGFIGPLATEGEYNIKLIKGDKVTEGKMLLMPLPTNPHSKEDRDLAHTTVMTLHSMCEELALMNHQVVCARDSAKALLPMAKNNKALTKSLNAFIAKMETQRATYIATTAGTAITGEEKLREKLSSLYVAVAYYEGRPTDSQLDRTRAFRKELDDAAAAADKIWKSDLSNVNTQLSKAGLSNIVLLSKEEFQNIKL